MPHIRVWFPGATASSYVCACSMMFHACLSPSAPLLRLGFLPLTPPLRPTLVFGAFLRRLLLSSPPLHCRRFAAVPRAMRVETSRRRFPLTTLPTLLPTIRGSYCFSPARPPTFRGTRGFRPPRVLCAVHCLAPSTYRPSSAVLTLTAVSTLRELGNCDSDGHWALTNVTLSRGETTRVVCFHLRDISVSNAKARARDELLAAQIYAARSLS